MGYTIWPDGPMGDAMRDITQERYRQEQLKEEGKFDFTTADLELSHEERYTILGEEFGEIGHEINESFGRLRKPLNIAKLRTELVQLAAVAIGWIEAIDKSYGRLRKPLNIAKLRTELVQLAAVAIGWIEAIDKS